MKEAVNCRLLATGSVAPLTPWKAALFGYLTPLSVSLRSPSGRGL